MRPRTIPRVTEQQEKSVCSRPLPPLDLPSVGSPVQPRRIGVGHNDETREEKEAERREGELGDGKQKERRTSGNAADLISASPLFLIPRTRRFLATGRLAATHSLVSIPLQTSPDPLRDPFDLPGVSVLIQTKVSLYSNRDDHGF